MLSKKGISPLIATVLVLGFVIILAALVFTWGGDLFKAMQQDTATTSQARIACNNFINLDINAIYDTEHLYISIDNKNAQSLAGFKLRAYLNDNGNTDVQTFDNGPPVGAYGISTFGFADFVTLEDGFSSEHVYQIGVFAKVQLDNGAVQTCEQEFEVQVAQTVLASVVSVPVEEELVEEEPVEEEPAVNPSGLSGHLTEAFSGPSFSVPSGFSADVLLAYQIYFGFFPYIHPTLWPNVEPIVNGGSGSLSCTELANLLGGNRGLPQCVTGMYSDNPADGALFRNHYDAVALGDHLEEVVSDTLALPGGYDYIIIDYESWFATWPALDAMGEGEYYQHTSRALCNHYRGSCSEAQAQADFESSAGYFLQQTVNKANQYRPGVKWGLYSYPLRFSQWRWDNFAGEIRSSHDQLAPLWDSLEVFTPSYYLYDDEPYQELRTNLAEAVRLSGNKEILFFEMHRYHPGRYPSSDARSLSDCSSLPDLLSPTSVETVVDVAVEGGADGVIFWINSLCEEDEAFFENCIGPAITSVARCT